MLRQVSVRGENICRFFVGGFRLGFMTLDQHVEGLLDILRKPRTVCAWCKHPDEPVKQKGLCSHCNRIRLELARLEKSAEQNGLTDFRLRVQREKVSACKSEGSAHQRLVDDAVSGLDIEHDLRTISKRLVGKELFTGYAEWFHRGFTDDQLALLRYFLNRIVLEHQRKNRLKTALWKAMAND